MLQRYHIKMKRLVKKPQQRIIHITTAARKISTMQHVLEQQVKDR